MLRSRYPHLYIPFRLTEFQCLSSSATLQLRSHSSVWLPPSKSPFCDPFRSTETGGVEQIFSRNDTTSPKIK